MLRDIFKSSINYNSLSKFTLNYILYRIWKYIYVNLHKYVINFILNVISFYSILLHLNRLTLTQLPKVCRLLILSFIRDKKSTIFSKIILDVSLSEYCKKLSKRIHIFWIVYTSEQNYYYTETNFKFNSNKDICNFYYFSKISKRKFIIFYYLDKLAFTNNPYFYNLYNTNIYTTLFQRNYKPTWNLRLHLLCMFIHTINMFIDHCDLSFGRFTYNTFSGLSNVFKHLDAEFKFELPEINRSTKINITPVTTVLHKSAQVMTSLFTNITLLTITSTKPMLAISKHIYEVVSNCKITWFTKIHNSTYNICKNIVVMYIRSSKQFNKGRYSRNRQLYRTGVYWCIWLNVVIVYGLYYYFYRVVFSFGYLWLPLGFMILTMFSSRLYKYRYYSLDSIRREMSSYVNLLSIVFDTIHFNLKYIYIHIIKLKIKVNTYAYVILAFFKNIF